MAEYIDRDVLKDRMAGFVPPFIDESNLAYVDGLTDAYTLICQAPASDVVVRKTGKWIYPSDVTGFGRCSECKALWDHSLITNKYFKICPRCGSYNRGDDDV